MARLRVRVELNRGGVGVPLHKLASVVHEAQRFFEMLAEDVHIAQDRGEWLGFDFDNESLNFTAEYVGAVSAEQAQSFYAAFDGITSLRRGTIAQFTQITEAIGEDELIGFGLYHSDQETDPDEWRCLSRRDALRIADEIQLLLGVSGEMHTETHLPAIIDSDGSARLFKERAHRSIALTDPSKMPDLVREVESNLSKRIARLEDDVENHSHTLRDLRETSAATEESFKGLLNAVENFCGQATRQLERLAPPAESSSTAVTLPAVAAPPPATPQPPVAPAGSAAPSTSEPSPAAAPVLSEAPLATASPSAPVRTLAAVTPAAPRQSSASGTSVSTAAPVKLAASVTAARPEPASTSGATRNWRAFAVAAAVAAILLTAGLLWRQFRPADQTSSQTAANSAAAPASASTQAPNDPQPSAEPSSSRQASDLSQPPLSPSQATQDAPTQAKPSPAPPVATAKASPTATPPRTTPVKPAIAPTAAPAKDETASSQPPAPESAAASESSADVMRVEMEAQEPVWVMVTDREGKILIARTLQANETRTLDLTTDATLRTGNAGGLRLRLNGRDLGPLGPVGKIRDVEFKSGAYKVSTPDAG